jgi:hypothetical protein
MPNMAAITVKAANGTTDVVFTNLNPAGGDGVPAVWRVEDAAKTPSERIRFEVSSKWNGPRTARKVSTFLNYPITRATAVAGILETVGNVQFREGGAVVPQTANDTVTAEATALHGNLMASALIKSVFATGYAPN